MANTTKRNVRVPDDLWEQVVSLAAENGTTPSDEVRAAIAAYCSDESEA